MNKILQGDCLELMNDIPNESIDMILCDLPYGTTASGWDSIISFPILWGEYERIIKPTGAIILTASGTFTHKVISSNEKLYKYKWIWKKTRKGNFVNAKNRPMTQFEEVLVFSKGNTANGSLNKMKYYPQGIIKVDKVSKKSTNKFGTMIGARCCHKDEFITEYENYPTDILEIANEGNVLHPTQKPTALFEYLIKTYTNEGDIVLDNCAGSGTTAIACLNTKRQFIVMEKEQKYYDIILKRVSLHNYTPNLFSKPIN
jgi:site-specific DNA-methyltransferase (adenine-specific)